MCVHACVCVCVRVRVCVVCVRVVCVCVCVCVPVYNVSKYCVRRVGYRVGGGWGSFDSINFNELNKPLNM